MDTPIGLVLEITSQHGYKYQTVRHITGKGIINHVSVIETTAGPIVARLNNEIGAAQRYIKEQWCLEQARGVGIPVPEVLAVGESGGYAYMLQEYIPGIPGDSPDVDRLRLWYTLGEYAARANSIPVHGYGGDMNLDQAATFVGTWQGMVKQNTARVWRDDYWITSEAFSAEQIVTLQALLEELAAIAGPTGLCYTDLGPKNTILSPGEHGTVYLIDWEFAEAAPIPTYQMACVAMYWGYHSKVMAAFIQGYGLSKAHLCAIEHEVKLLTVAGALNVVRWAQDNQPLHIEESTTSARFIVHDLFGSLL